MNSASPQNKLFTGLLVISHMYVKTNAKSFIPMLWSMNAWIQIQHHVIERYKCSIRNKTIFEFRNKLCLLKQWHYCVSEERDVSLIFLQGKLQRKLWRRRIGRKAEQWVSSGPDTQGPPYIWKKNGWLCMNAYVATVPVALSVIINVLNLCIFHVGTNSLPEFAAACVWLLFGLDQFVYTYVYLTDAVKLQQLFRNKLGCNISPNYSITVVTTQTAYQKCTSHKNKTPPPNYTCWLWVSYICKDSVQLLILMAKSLCWWRSPFSIHAHVQISFVFRI